MAETTVSRRAIGRMAGLLVIGGTVVVSGHSAGAVPVPNTVTISFSGETTGPRTQPFTVAAFPRWHFSTTDGTSPLRIYDGSETHGPGIGAFGDSTAGVRIQLDRPTVRMSLAFGNDDDFFTNPGDVAVLRAFRRGAPLGSRSVVMNRNDLPDQRVEWFDNGKLADEFRFTFERPGSGPIKLTELVDDIKSEPLCSIAGDESKNTLIGTNGNDVICGGGNDDIINALGGNDVVFAGNGNDIVDLGPGADVANGGNGKDTIHGRDGNDVIDGNGDVDKIFGDGQADICFKTPGDTLSSCETVRNS